MNRQELLRAHKFLALRDNLAVASRQLAAMGELVSLKYAELELKRMNIRSWNDLCWGYLFSALQNPFPGGVLYNLAAACYAAKKHRTCLVILWVLRFKKKFPCTDVQPHGKVQANRLWLAGRAWIGAGFLGIGYRLLKAGLEAGGNFGQETMFIVKVAQSLGKPKDEVLRWAVLGLPYNHRYPTEFCMAESFHSEK